MLLVRMFSWLTIWYWIIGLFFPREDFPSCSDCSLVTYSSLCRAEALQDVFDVPWHASCCPCSAHVQADKLTGLHMSLLKFPGDTVSEQTLALTYIFFCLSPDNVFWALDIQFVLQICQMYRGPKSLYFVWLGFSVVVALAK